MARTERNLKIHFLVCLVVFVICQSELWYVLLTEHSWGVSSWIMFAIGVSIMLCLFGLGYCWLSARRSRLEYQQMRREQQAEMNALIDEIEEARKILS